MFVGHFQGFSVQRLQAGHTHLHFFQIGAGVYRGVVLVVFVFFGGGFRDRGFVALVGVDEAQKHVGQTGLAVAHPLVFAEDERGGLRETGEGGIDLLEAFLDALGDGDFAFPGEQFDGAHFTHVHAHRIGGAAEFAVHRDQGLSGFLGGSLVGFVDGVVVQQQFVGFRGHFPDGDPHVVDHVDDVFDLIGIDDIVGQVVVYFGVGQVALFFAFGDQELELGLLLLIHSDDPRSGGYRGQNSPLV